MTKHLEQDAPKQLIYFKRIADSTNGRKGTYTHDTSEVDEIARQLWSKIYHGKEQNQQVRVAEFYNKYERFTNKQKQIKAMPFTMQQVKHACIHAKHTAKGLDHVEPEAFGQLSD